MTMLWRDCRFPGINGGIGDSCGHAEQTQVNDNSRRTEMKRLFGLVLTFAATSAAADNPPIFDAIRSGDMALVKAHLTKADLESRGARGTTPLMYAAAFGNLETLRALLDAGADVNTRNDLQA